MITVLALTLATPALAAGPKGFDEFGYNYQARLFNGPADGSDRKNDGTVWGDPSYANDHLVMKWSQAWDDAHFHGAPWTSEAWVSNQWNGNVPGGSGESEHVKIVWIGGDCGADYEPLPDGGYCIWGAFEVIFDHYTGANGYWLAHVAPAGYGAYK